MRLYLDIDGVITARPYSFPGIETFTVGGFFDGAAVEWHPEMFYTLVNGFDEVVWATTWILAPSLLDELEKKLGVKYERSPLTRANYNRSPLTCGKLRAVRKHYEANPAPFTWIDDHAGPSDHTFAEEEGGRLIVPTYETGGVYKIMAEDEAFS